MKHTVKSEDLIINNASGNFCDTVMHAPENAQEAEYGTIFLTAEFLEDPECSNELIAIMMDEAIATFYEDLNRDTFESFEVTLHNINAALGKYAESNASWVGKANLALGILSQNTLHITTAGSGETYLIRDGQIICISEDLSSEEEAIPSKTFFNISSGELDENDLIIFSNSKIDNYYPLTGFVTVAKNSVQEIPKTLAKNISLSPGSNLSFLFVKIGEVEEEVHTTNRIDTITEETEATEDRPKIKKANKIFGLAKIGADKMKHLNLTDNQWIAKLRNQAAKHAGNVTQILKKKQVTTEEESTSLFKKATEKTTSLVILSCISILILVLAINFIKQDSSTSAIEMRSLYNEINGRIDDADLKSLYDRNAAIELLTRQEERLAELDQKGFSNAKIKESINDIKIIRDKIFNTIRFKNPEVKASIKGQFADANPKGMVMKNDSVVAYDTKTIYEIADSAVNNKVVIPAEESDIITNATSLTEDGAILLTTNLGKMIKVKEGVVEEITTNEGWPANASDITEYKGTAKIYVLEPTANQIWYHAITGTKASNKAPRNSTEADLSNAVSLSVDGNIFVLKDDQTIIKTYGSERQNFELTGVPDQLIQATKLFTSKDHNRLYLLYPQNNAIAFLTKDGRFLGQYVLETPSKERIIDFYPDEENKFLHILGDDSNIYKLEIL